MSAAVLCGPVLNSHSRGQIAPEVEAVKSAKEDEKVGTIFEVLSAQSQTAKVRRPESAKEDLGFPPTGLEA
jgi:hypothetical protein